MGSVKYTAFFVFSRGSGAADVSVLTGFILKLVENKFTCFGNLFRAKLTKS